MLIVIVIGLLGEGLLLFKWDAQSSLPRIAWRLVLDTSLSLLTAFSVAHLLGQNLLPDVLQAAFWLTGDLSLVPTYLLTLALLVGLHMLAQMLIDQPNRWGHRPLGWADVVILLVSAGLVFTGVLVAVSAHWGMNYFGTLAIDQILYFLTQPAEGTESSQIDAFIQSALIPASAISLAIVRSLAFALAFRPRVRRNQPLTGVRRTLVVGFSVVVFGGTVFLGAQRIGLQALWSYFFESSTLYETEYRNPRKVELTFPKQKRNLIYIYLESTEASYFSKSLGGALSDNLMPRMAELAEGPGINFSNTEKLGGAQQVPGVGFTAGGMVAQSAGVPVITSVNENDYGSSDATTKYMPGAYSIGQILEQEGYDQTLLLGSDAAFGGRDKYFTQHGHYRILDYPALKEEGVIDPDYHIGWGIDDKTLFSVAREELTSMADEDQPFNLTMLTADTHFEDGVMTDETPTPYDNQYSNVIQYNDTLVGDFLDWAMDQPWYDNTTIVLAGDHLTMAHNFFNDLPESYTRTVFNLFLNSAVEPVERTNRDFTTLDLYPSTLAAMGVTIEGDRMGLGTNLFSTKKTLMEKLGGKALNAEMAKSSKYYQAKIIKDSELGVDQESRTSKPVAGQ